MLLRLVIFLTSSGTSCRQFPHLIMGFFVAGYFRFCLGDNCKAKDHAAMAKACSHGQEGGRYCRECIREVEQGISLCGERRLLSDLH